MELSVTVNTAMIKSLIISGSGKSSQSVQCAITGPRLYMRHMPSAERTVPIRKICCGTRNLNWFNFLGEEEGVCWFTQKHNGFFEHFEHF